MFRFSQKSKDKLALAHPALERVAYKAIEISKVDFTVMETLRTIETQRKYVERGVSKTMDSKHLKQADGFSHAMDLVPWIGGQARWEWPPIFDIAEAIREAAVLYDTQIRWGGFWGNLTHSSQSAEELHLGYVNRKLAQGKHPFADGPHFELII